MLLVLIVSLLAQMANTKSILVPESVKTSDKLYSCATNILKKYFIGVDLTYVDICSDDDDGLLKSINNDISISLIIGYPYLTTASINRGYLVYAKSIEDFVRDFISIVQGPQWNPRCRFLIIVEDLDTKKLRLIFDELLKYHVINVLVIDGRSLHLYTYNPFENYGCGKKYNRVIHYGRCCDLDHPYLYPRKIITGLRNCTFNVLAYSKWLPFSTDDRHDASFGIDQYILEILSEVEQFNINYTYDTEDYYTMANDNMSMSSILSDLKNNVVDMHIGGMLLTPDRAETFDYLWGYLPYFDEINVIVKRTNDIAFWKYAYIEFNGDAWALIAFVFIFYWSIMVYNYKVKDKSGLVLKMLDALFLHGCKLNMEYVGITFMYIFWMWFAYFINTFYHANLTRYLVNPVREMQVSTEEQLESYDFKRCTSAFMDSTVTTAIQGSFMNHQKVTKGCGSIQETMNMVSQSEGVYTMTLKTLYHYHMLDYVTEQGEMTTYMFEKPMFKLVYGFLLYKGFPMQEELHQLVLRLKDIGVIDVVFKYIYRLKTDKIHLGTHVMCLVIPWSAFKCGCGLAVLIFIFELVIGNRNLCNGAIRF